MVPEDKGTRGEVKLLIFRKKQVNEGKKIRYFFWKIREINLFSPLEKSKFATRYHQTGASRDQFGLQNISRVNR